MFALLFTFLFAMVLVGVGITLSGWFGPRLDDHPHCAKCHYDLTGLQSDHCPECGTFIGAKVNVVHSQRLRDWRRIFTGLGLIVVVAAGWYGANWWQEELASRPVRLSRAVMSDDVKTVAAFLADDPKLSNWRVGMGPEEIALRRNAPKVLALLLARHPRGQVPVAEPGKPMLHVAVMLPWGVDALLQHGVPVDERDKEGNTALHVTMREMSANKSWVKTLLEAGADPNARNALQETPLHYAFLGHDEVKVLIAAGADVNARDLKGRTPMHRAMLERGVYATAGTEAICDAGADLSARDLEGKTPGQIAQERGHGQTASLLWQRQLEPARKARDLAKVKQLLLREPQAMRYGAGSTEGCLLQWAAGWRDVDLVRVMLELGADPNVVNARGETPLWHANVEMANLLIEHGADVNHLDTQKQTALHAAIDMSHKAEVEMLLRRGADVHRGASLTRCVAMSQHPNGEIMKMLFDAGVAPDIFSAIVLGETEKVRAMFVEDFAKATRLHEGVRLIIPAIRARRDDIVLLMLETGANPNLKSEYDNPGRERMFRTPLHEAVSYGRKNVVRMLLEHGADPNVPSLSGEMGLHWAVWRDVETARWMLEHGANVNAKDSQGRTPLHAAARFPTDPEIVRLYLERGANPAAKDNGGRTPLDVAQREGRHPPVVAILKAAASQPATGVAP